MMAFPVAVSVSSPWSSMALMISSFAVILPSHGGATARFFALFGVEIETLGRDLRDRGCRKLRPADRVPLDL